MSRRAKVFQSHLSLPAVESNFWVLIPNIETSLVMVEDCTLPFPVYKEIQAHDKGKTYYYPGTIDMPGQWSCSFAETINGLHTMEALNFLVSGQNQGGSIFRKTEIILAVTVGSTDIPIPHMLFLIEGAWITSLTPLQLNSANGASSMKIRVNFRYDSVINIPLAVLDMDVFNLKKQLIM